LPQQDLYATKADHAEEVLDVVLPTNHEPAKMMEPSEKSFHSPASAVAAQRATILGTSDNASKAEDDVFKRLCPAPGIREHTLDPLNHFSPHANITNLGPLASMIQQNECHDGENNSDRLN
jgi:hypothetical protein